MRKRKPRLCRDCQTDISHRHGLAILCEPCYQVRERARQRACYVFSDKTRLKIGAEKLNRQGELDFMSEAGRRAFVLDGSILDAELKKRGLVQKTI